MVANCGEQPLRENESCNLGSINLSKFIKGQAFNLNEYERVIRIAVRFLDAVIDRNSYPTEDIERETKRTRKIGLGVMGWADTLILMGYLWRSDDALRLAEELGGILRKVSRDESHRLSSMWTSFDAIDDSVFTGRGGMRNATTTTIAPTGTLSFLAGCSSGIEPVYDWFVTRQTEQGKEIIPHPLIKMVEGTTLMSDTALNISPDWHLAHVQAWQKNIDNAVSKTVNLRKDATPKDVAYIYAEAFKKGLKGVTIYRDGSRDEQALRQVQNEAPCVKPSIIVRKDIERYPAHVYKMNSGCGFCWVIVAERDDKMQNLEHVFVLTDGGCSANNESTGRGISLMLQKDVPIEDICRFLGKVKCFNAMKNPSSQGKSCSDIIGQCIKMEHDDFVDAMVYPAVMNTITTALNAPIDKIFASSCPECGAKLNFESGCGAGTCKVCGWSGCH
jgi:ribonucleoside-diphosphate reductase alpha chain